MENEDQSQQNLKSREGFSYQSTSREDTSREDTSGKDTAGEDMGATFDLSESVHEAKFDVTAELASTNEADPGRPVKSSAAEKPEIIEGMQIGRYRIRSLLGQGGMGSVFLAYDEVLARDVALKIPKFDNAAKPETLKRFHREARTAANVAHPNLCPVFDIGEIDGWQFIAMAYIKGFPLSDYTSGVKFISQRGIAEIVNKVALGLQEAHLSGIMHRDLKPANIMLDHRNEPIVMDFGLACPQEPDDDRLTKDGMVIGSPAYMSPEQIRGVQKEITHATDIYSLGVVLYEMLSGRLPYKAESTIALIGQILTVDPLPVETHRPDIDSRLAGVCATAMAKKVEHRFRTMTDFADALQAYLQGAFGQDAQVADSTEHAALKEQVKLAKRFCQTGRRAAAIPILEEILLADTSDEYCVEVRAWARQQLTDLKEPSRDSSRQKPEQNLDLAGQMKNAFSGLDAVIPKMPAIPKAPSTNASAFETSLMQNLYASEKRETEHPDEQPEPKVKESSEETIEERSPQAKAPRSIADILNEMRESAVLRINRDSLSPTGQKDQDDTGHKS